MNFFGGLAICIICTLRSLIFLCPSPQSPTQSQGLLGLTLCGNGIIQEKTSMRNISFDKCRIGINCIVQVQVPLCQKSIYLTDCILFNVCQYLTMVIIFLLVFIAACSCQIIPGFVLVVKVCLFYFFHTQSVDLTNYCTAIKFISSQQQQIVILINTKFVCCATNSVSVRKSKLL